MYIVSRADFKDTCSVLFYVCDSQQTGVIDQTDLLQILQYLDMDITPRDIEDICGQ